MTRHGMTLRWFAAGLVLSAPAWGQPAQSPSLQNPCRVLFESPEHVRSSFESQGGSLAEGVKRERALPGLATVMALVLVRPSLWSVEDEEDAEALPKRFDSLPPDAQVRIGPEVPVFIKGDASAAVILAEHDLGPPAEQACWLAASRLPELDTMPEFQSAGPVTTWMDVPLDSDPLDIHGSFGVRYAPSAPLAHPAVEGVLVLMSPRDTP